MTTATAVAFAGDIDSGAKIETADQLKQAMASDMDDGSLSAAEKKALLDSSTETAVAELIKEKMDVAADLLNGREMTAEMKNLTDGSAYAVCQYDLGD